MLKGKLKFKNTLTPIFTCILITIGNSRHGSAGDLLIEHGHWLLQCIVSSIMTN